MHSRSRIQKYGCGLQQQINTLTDPSSTQIMANLTTFYNENSDSLDQIQNMAGINTDLENATTNIETINNNINDIDDDITSINAKLNTINTDIISNNDNVNTRLNDISNTYLQQVVDLWMNKNLAQDVSRNLNIIENNFDYSLNVLENRIDSLDYDVNIHNIVTDISNIREQLLTLGPNQSGGRSGKYF